MSDVVKSAAQMLEMLPEEDQNFAHEFIKKLVLAWDPDFTKATPSEQAAIDKAVMELEMGSM